MQIAPFALERYFARHEFSARYLLSSSDCEALTLPELLSLADAQTRRLWDELKLGYTESPGHPLLRQEIARQYAQLEADGVLVLVPEEGIFLLMHALLAPGDHVVSTFPGYQSLYEVARAIGCQVSFWEPEEENGWRFDPARLGALLRPETRLVVANFPHNPTGYLPPRADYDALLDIVGQRGIHLLSDEMYRGLELEPAHTLPPACDLYRGAISLSGMSKVYGLPGLRLGWLAAQDKEVLQRVSVLKDYTTICNSAPSEILALIALRARGTIITRQRERVAANLAVLEQFIAGHPQLLRLNRPGGGSICFPRLEGVADTQAFCDRLVERAGIMLLPSSIFEYGNRHVRIGIGRVDFPEVLGRFGDYLEQGGGAPGGH